MYEIWRVQKFNCNDICYSKINLKGNNFTIFSNVQKEANKYIKHVKNKPYIHNKSIAHYLDDLYIISDNENIKKFTEYQEYFDLRDLRRKTKKYNRLQLFKKKLLCL